MTELEEAILIHRESLFHSSGPLLFTRHLANALCDHFDRTGLMTDLQEAILLHRESLSLCPTSHTYYSRTLFNLAILPQRHFRRTGSMADLEQAILLLRESLSFRPTSHPDRFGKTGSMTDVLNHSTAFHVRFGIVLERQVQ